MKILKRTKGILNFRNTSWTISLKAGDNVLTEAEGKLIKAHPMFEAMVKTSGLIEVVEAPKPKAKTPAQIKAEKKAAKKATDEAEAARLAEEAANADSDEDEDDSDEDDSEGDEDDSDEDGIDLSDIDLKKQDKKALVEIAEALKLETKGLNADQIIKLIESKK